MKRCLFWIIAMMFVATFVADSADAFYNSALGRFVNRDPGVANARSGGTRFVALDQYRDGPNLYQYVRSNPAVGLDPLGLIWAGVTDGDGNIWPQGPIPEEFYVCGRKPRGKDCGNAIVRASGIMHVDIFSTNQGRIRVGFGGEVNQDDPEVVPLDDPDWSCTKLIRRNHSIQYYDSIILALIFGDDRRERIVRYGDGRGLGCSSATDAEIASCLRRAPIIGPYCATSRNCQTDVESAARACCLTGYIGISLGRLPLDRIPVE